MGLGSWWEKEMADFFKIKLIDQLPETGSRVFLLRAMQYLYDEVK